MVSSDKLHDMVLLGICQHNRNICSAATPDQTEDPVSITPPYHATSTSQQLVNTRTSDGALKDALHPNWTPFLMENAVLPLHMCTATKREMNE